MSSQINPCSLRGTCEIDAVMFVKAMVLSCEHRVHKNARDIGQRHHPPLFPIAVVDGTQQLRFELDQVSGLACGDIFNRFDYRKRRNFQSYQGTCEVIVIIAKGVHKKHQAAVFLVKAVFALESDLAWVNSVIVQSCGALEKANLIEPRAWI